MTHTEIITRLCELVACIEDIRQRTKDDCCWVCDELEDVSEQVQLIAKRAFSMKDFDRIEELSAQLDTELKDIDTSDHTAIRRIARSLVLQETGMDKLVERLLRHHYRNLNKEGGKQ